MHVWIYSAIVFSPHCQNSTDWQLSCAIIPKAGGGGGGGEGVVVVLISDLAYG